MAENEEITVEKTTQTVTKEDIDSYESSRDIVSEDDFNNGGMDSVWGSYENYTEGNLSVPVTDKVSFDVNVENVDNACLNLNKIEKNFDENHRTIKETYTSLLEDFLTTYDGPATEYPEEDFTSLCENISQFKQDLNDIKDDLVEYATNKDLSVFDAEMLGRFGIDPSLLGIVAEAVDKAANATRWQQIGANIKMVGVGLYEGLTSPGRAILDGFGSAVGAIFGADSKVSQWAKNKAEEQRKNIQGMYDELEKTATIDRNSGWVKGFRIGGGVVATAIAFTGGAIVGGPVAGGVAAAVTGVASATELIKHSKPQTLSLPDTLPDALPDTSLPEDTAPDTGVGGGSSGGGYDGGGGGGGGSDEPATEAPTTAPVTETPTVAPTEPPKDDPGTVIDSTGNGGNDFSGEGMSFDEPEKVEELETDIGEDLDSSDSIVTIPTTIRGTTTKSTNKTSAAVPVLGALGVAAAAGVGAKIYMDSKTNNENSDDENYDEYENSNINADEWNGDSYDDESDTTNLSFDNKKIDDLEQGMGEI